jgi:hypothetical protein
VSTADQEVANIESLLRRASEGIFTKKGELLNEIEHTHGKALRSGWVNRFLTRYQEDIAAGIVYPQEDPRLEILRAFLNQYFALVREQIVGLRPHLVSNIDETGSSD